MPCISVYNMEEAVVKSHACGDKHLNLSIDQDNLVWLIWYVIYVINWRHSVMEFCLNCHWMPWKCTEILSSWVFVELEMYEPWFILMGIFSSVLLIWGVWFFALHGTRTVFYQYFSHENSQIAPLITLLIQVRWLVHSLPMLYKTEALFSLPSLYYLIHYKKYM